MNLIKEHKAFLVILLSSCVLRFIPLFDYQFTFDELSGLDRTQFDSFGELIERGVKVDAHPPFVQVLIYYLVKWFGYVTWVVKLPFLLFGTGAMIYAYALGVRNFSKNVGLLVSVFLSFSLVFVYYAPIARMYITGVFFSFALLYYFFEITFLVHRKWSNYFFLGLFAWLSAINHHMNGLFAATVLFSGFQFLGRGGVNKYALTCLLVVLAYLPVVRITLYQVGLAGIGYEQGGWLDKPEVTAVFTFIKVLLGTGKSWLVIVCFCALYFVFNQNFSLTKKQIFLLSLFLINYLIIYLYSVYRAPVFQNSVMLFSGCSLLLFFSSLMDFRNPALFKVCLLAITALLVFKTYFRKDYLHQCVKTTFEYQFERTFYYKDKLGEKNVYPLLFDADEVMKKIYFTKYGRAFDCKISSDSVISYGSNVQIAMGDENKIVSSIKLFSDFVSSLNCDYVALSASTPLYEGIVQHYFPILLENTQTQGVYYKLYSRKKEDAKNKVKNDSITFYMNALKSDYLRIDSTAEFPFGQKLAYGSLSAREGQMILARAVLDSGNTGKALELCISTAIKEGESIAYSAKSLSDFKEKEGITVLYCDQFIGTQHKKIRGEAETGIYLWNRGKENHTLRGFEVMVVDYWRQKWHFWD